ncbi:MAG: T9SS type A sorting domain-containing protein [Bacteroidia bacterium]
MTTFFTKSLTILALSISLLATTSQAQILLDENFIDWIPASLQYSDALGDASGIDFISLSASSNNDYLFIKIELDREINLQDNNNIGLFIDTDNDISSGLVAEGIGVDVLYTFGEREGTFYNSAGRASDIRHRDLGVVTLPTVTSSTFEIAIKRDAIIDGEPVFANDSIRIVLQNQANNGDIIPDQNGGLLYVFENNPPGPNKAYSLSKPDTSLTRIMSYNVLRDGLWDNQQAPALRRIISALHPDIIGFQEIYNQNSEETRDEVNSILFSQYNQGWYHAEAGNDIKCVSKYPILSTWPVAGNGAFVIDMGSHELLLFVAHPPCCSNDQGRQQEIDAMMAFIRDAKAGTNGPQLRPNTPIVILGDMNLVGLNRQRTTMLTGDIEDNNQYGADFTPDWNGDDLIDAKPFATGLPMAITWWQLSSSFAPGRLDYLIYSDSNMELENNFALFTETMPAAELAAFGLQASDATEGSDHLPLIGDFRFTLGPPAGLVTDNAILDLQCVPNPITSQTAIAEYTLPEAGQVSLNILDNIGRTVYSVKETVQTSGKHQIPFDVSSLSSGMYVLKLTTAKHQRSIKILVK